MCVTSTTSLTFSVLFFFLFSPGEAEAVRTHHLVEDLLTLSRLEDNRNRLAVSPVNIPELISSLLNDAEQLSNGRHTITKHIDAPWLLANRDEIASAFGNLITNAVRYTPAGGTIHVEWSQANNHAPLVFRVTDNGDGIGAKLTVININTVATWASIHRDGISQII